MTTTTQQVIANTVETAFEGKRVFKAPLKGPDGMETPHFGLFVTNGDSFDNLPGSTTVKAGYVPHTTEDVVTLTEAAAYGFDCPIDELKIDCAWGNRGHRVSVQPTKSYRQTIANDKDSVWPKLVVRSDYGGSAFKATMGMYRDACSNMQMMRKVTTANIAIAHRANFRENFDATVEQFSTLAAQYDSVILAARHLNDVRVATVDFLAEMYDSPAESDRSKTIHKNRTEAIVTRVMKEREKLGIANAYNAKEATLWELVNGITGYVQHDMGSQKKRTAADGFKAFDHPMSNKAFELAFTMAN